MMIVDCVRPWSFLAGLTIGELIGVVLIWGLVVGVPRRPPHPLPKPGSAEQRRRKPP